MYIPFALLCLNKVLLEESVVPYPVRRIPYCLEPEGSLLFSQQLALYLYPNADSCSPCLSILLMCDPFNQCGSVCVWMHFVSTDAFIKLQETRLTGLMYLVVARLVLAWLELQILEKWGFINLTK